MNAWRQVALAVVSFFASMTLAILLARDAMLHAWTPFHFLFVSITVLLVALNAVQVSWCVLPSCTDPCVVLTVQWSAMLLCTALLLLCAVPSTPGRNRISPWLFETAVPATVLLTVLQGVKVSGVMEMEKTAMVQVHAFIVLDERYKDMKDLLGKVKTSIEEINAWAAREQQPFQFVVDGHGDSGDTHLGKQIQKSSPTTIFAATLMPAATRVTEDLKNATSLGKFLNENGGNCTKCLLLLREDPQDNTIFKKYDDGFLKGTPFSNVIKLENVLERSVNMLHLNSYVAPRDDQCTKMQEFATRMSQTLGSM